jgi:hypothetical protein
MFVSWCLAAMVMAGGILSANAQTQTPAPAGAPFCVIGPRTHITEEQLAQYLANQWAQEWEKKDFLETYRKQFQPPPVYCSYYDTGSCKLAAEIIAGTCVANPNR